MNHKFNATPAKKDEYACIIIGDEILDTRVVEINLAVLIKALYAIGYKLQEARILPDEVETLSSAISELRKKCCTLITIGGLGATHDDRTMEAYALSFQQTLNIHKEMYDFLHLKPRPTKEMQDAVACISKFPQHAEIIQIDDTWPVIKLENCFALPGIPRVCKLTIEKLAKILPKQGSIFYQNCCVRVQEHQYFSWLNSFVEKWEPLSIGSYPIAEHAKILSKISITGRNKNNVDACLKEMRDYFQTQGWLISK